MRWYRWRYGRLTWALGVAGDRYIANGVSWRRIGLGLFWGSKLF